ncbi:MAG TPA: DUF3343 domain-containing protein [Verrucomicrobiae bacterium]|nr:DUF3343 domain-containing protein [Verrucomicrobiae bacterium]
MVEDGDFIAIFNSIHRVMKAEKILKARNLDILLIPAPRGLTADCGLAIRYREPVRAEVESALLAESVQPEEVYRKEGDGFRRL